MELTIRAGRADAPPGSELLEAMLAELTPVYGRIDVPGAPTATPEQMSPPGGAFLVVWRGEDPVACGGRSFGAAGPAGQRRQRASSAA